VVSEEGGAGDKFGAHGSVEGEEELGLKESELGREMKGPGEGSSEIEGKKGKWKVVGLHRLGLVD